MALWYKDGREIKANEKLDFSEGVLNLEIAQVTSIYLTLLDKKLIMVCEIIM